VVGRPSPASAKRSAFNADCSRANRWRHSNAIFTVSSLSYAVSNVVGHIALAILYLQPRQKLAFTVLKPNCHQVYFKNQGFCLGIAIPDEFSNPVIPGLVASNPGNYGIEKLSIKCL